MANTLVGIEEERLQQKSTLGMSDYVRVVGADGVSYKQELDDVSNKVITEYTDIPLAGNNQSVKDAINGLDTSKADNSDLQSSIDTVNDRIDNIITSPAPTEQEIIDARLGADGVTYPSLGDAIRDQVSDLKDDFDTGLAALNANLTYIGDSVEFVTIPISMSMGGLNGSGQKIESTNRAVSNMMPVSMACPKIVFPQGTKHRFAYYSSSQESIGFLYFSDWSTEINDEIEFYRYPGATNQSRSFRILIGYADDRTITDATAVKPSIDYWNNSNKGVPCVGGYYVSSENSCVVTDENNDFIISAILPVEPNTVYRSNKFRNTQLFDANMQFKRLLPGPTINGGLITTNSDERYLIYCWKKTDCDVSYFGKEDDYVNGANINNLVPITLKGKRLSLLGDSISAFAGTIPSGYDAYYTGSNSGVENKNQMWWSVLCDNLGMIPIIINGYSGSGITQLEDSAHVSKLPMSSDERCSGLHSGTTNPDIVIIAGGVNDYTYALSAQSEPLEWDGLTAPVLGNSFTEAYACMIKKIQTNYPNAIVVALSTWFTMRGNDNGYTLTHTVGNNVYTQTDYNNAIKDVCEQMHIPYIDVSNIGFNRNNFYPNYAQDDASIPTHPNANGHRVMGDAIARKLPELVKGFLK